MQTQDLIETAVELVPYFKNLETNLEKHFCFNLWERKNALLLLL